MALGRADTAGGLRPANPNPDPNPNPNPTLTPTPTPTPNQAGCLDAGHFVIKLQAELAAAEGAGAVGGTGKEPRTCYDEWIEERRRPFYDSEPELPVAVCAWP